MYGEGNWSPSYATKRLLWVGGNIGQWETGHTAVFSPGLFFPAKSLPFTVMSSFCDVAGQEGHNPLLNTVVNNPTSLFHPALE